MGIFLQAGVIIGAAIGLVHAVHLLRLRQAWGGPGPALWFALWALALWTVFGAYVLFFWLAGAAGMAVAATIRPAAIRLTRAGR